MSMIDGVNKVFLVKHDSNSMHFEGFKDERALVEQKMYSAGWGASGYSAEDQIKWLKSLRGRINACIREHKKP